MKIWETATALALIGSISIVGITNRASAQENTRNGSEYVKVGLFSPAKKIATKAREEEQRSQNDNAIVDRLFPLALSSGKAIVIVPMPNMDLVSVVSQASDGSNFEINDLTRLLRNTLLTWSKRGAPDKSLQVGVLQDSKLVGARGYFFAFNADRLTYLVYFVEPGTYDLTGAYFQVPRSALPRAPIGPISRNAAVGQIAFKEFQHVDGEDKWQEWQPEESQQVFSHNECAQQIVTGQMAGTCTQNRPVYRREVTRAAGLQWKSRLRYSTGLLVKASLSENFSSFTVQPGEAVLVNGLFPEQPVAYFQNADCSTIEGAKVECIMRQFSLAELSGSLAAVQQRQAFATQSGFPELGRILATANYRPLSGQAGESETRTGKFGKIYLISIR